MCNHMYRTRDIYGNPIKVPCGSCITCRRTQATWWSHRIQHDVATLDRLGIGSSFITLTIESETTPVLRKSDLQKFFKRLRKRRPDYPFRYAAIGDYGENTFRPHYHALLLGFPPELSADVRKCWKFGFIDVEPIASGNINYVVRYMQTHTPSQRKKFVDAGLQEPFSLKSRSIGSTLMRKVEDSRYTYKCRQYKVPPYWQGILNCAPSPTDLSYYTDVARRNGFANVQSYLDYKSRVAEYVATKSNQNKLKPAQGIKYILDNKLDFSVSINRVDIPNDIF